ncbi:MICOS complex subunit MIC60 [Zancudomyces culisetae]|uniref:MICOS complex subunit MIC60 n=1 Tax=Zancudomyces culisetae TaxID=1213189 RepID=A0A1R1PFL7_ZANCU|nr:MICOS complex subunit MIC60 [Zancudomyces culisetae]|eukprot:OMH79800.1 MICOS complex subunit MIC60 [Zancudomyces culisetae]
MYKLAATRILGTKGARFTTATTADVKKGTETPGSPTPSASSSSNPPKTTATKPKKKWRKTKLLTRLTMLYGVLLVAGGYYIVNQDIKNKKSAAQEDPNYQQIKSIFNSLPFTKEYMETLETHNGSLLNVLKDVEYTKDAKYVADFILENLKFMVHAIKTGNWDFEQRPKEIHSQKPVPQQKEQIKTGVASNPVESIKVEIEFPVFESVEPKITELSVQLSRVIEILNHHDISRSTLAELRDLSDAFKAVDKRFYEIRIETDALVKSELSKQNEAHLQAIELLLREFEIQRAQLLESAGNDLLLAVERQKQLDEASALQLVEQVKQQMTAKFDGVVRHKVDMERDGRLAQLQVVEAHLNDLSSSVEKLLHAADSNRQAARVEMAANALAVAVCANDRYDAKSSSVTGGTSSFTNELTKLTYVLNEQPDLYPASTSAIKSVKVSENVPSHPQLLDRFDYLAKQISKVSLMPVPNKDNGTDTDSSSSPQQSSFFNYLVSSTLSRFMATKHGLVEGTDTEAVLARTRYYLLSNNLDAAARELNQLQGWPKVLASDWLDSARSRLEIEQFLNVLQAERLFTSLSL